MKYDGRTERSRVDFSRTLRLRWAGISPSWRCARKPRFSAVLRDFCRNSSPVWDHEYTSEKSPPWFRSAWKYIYRNKSILGEVNTFSVLTDHFPILVQNETFRDPTWHTVSECLFGDFRAHRSVFCNKNNHYLSVIASLDDLGSRTTKKLDLWIAVSWWPPFPGSQILDLV